MNSTLQFLNKTVREGDSNINFHSHPIYEIVYYLRGEGVTTIGGRRYDYEPGCFSIIHPEVLHDEYRRSETEVIYFGFFWNADTMQIPTGVFKDTADQNLLAIIGDILKEHDSKKSYFAMRINTLLQLLLIDILRLITDENDQKNDEKLKYANKYIEQYFTRNINLTELASISGYSYDHFRHLFKKSTGFSPINYILQLRINYAKKLLLDPYFSLTDIARECGFYSLSHFSNCFKKFTGHSPNHFRMNTDYHTENLDKKMKRIVYK